MGKLTRKELEDLEYYVELAKRRLKDANPALLTFGQVLTTLLQDRLATLPEEAKPPTHAIEQPADVRSLYASVNDAKPQPERCGGSPGKPNWKHRITDCSPKSFNPDHHPDKWHLRVGYPGCEQGPEFGEPTYCIPCPGCPDCTAKPWHLQAAEAIWEAEERAEEDGNKAPSVEEIAALILKYAPEEKI